MRDELDPAMLLRQYCDAAADEDADRLVVTILEDVARPLVRRVVASAMSRDPGGFNDLDDVVADTLADLLRRLRDLREPGAVPIHDLRGYIATCAYNRCHEELRHRYPARNRLRNQLQYLCGRHPELAVWYSAGGTIVCGPRTWQGREPASEAAAERVSLAARSDPAAENRAQLIALVPALFRAVGAPLELNALVAAVARLIGLDPHPPAELRAASAELTAELAIDDALVLRTSLRALWDDVRRLAPQQRAALLLNLRDTRGNDCAGLLPLTRTASMADIAAALEMPVEVLGALWNDLPLSDARIAELLHVTQRQVVKLRRLARERLRRMETRRDQNLDREFGSTLKDLGVAARRRIR